MTLADGSVADGGRYRVVQGYKDFATSGWVIGVFTAEDNANWQLRWTELSELPWKHASVTRSPAGWIVTAQTGADSFKITEDQFSSYVPTGVGWSFPKDASRAEMQSGLLHTTY